MGEFLQTPAGIATATFTATLLLVGVVVGLTRLYTTLKTRQQGYPYEKIIEDALLPHLGNAIMVAYKASETAMDNISERLHGIDKARVARLVYNYLPDQIEIGGVKWAWKLYVDEPKFARWVQERFESFETLWETAKEGILMAILPPESVRMGPVENSTFRISPGDTTPS